MPDAADLVAAADTLVQSSLFNEAIATYTKAIELAPTAPGYYIKRSTAHQRAGNFEAALKDAEQAVVLAKQRGKAELIAQAQIRRGISLNALKRYADSNEVFQLAKKAGSKDKSIDIWVNKNNRELAKGKEPIVQEVILVPEEEKTSNIDAVPKELHYSTEPKQPEKTDSKGETASTGQATVVESESSAKSESHTAASAAPPSAPAVPSAPTRVRHEWYQTDQFVFVDVFFKNIPKNQCIVEIEPHSLSVTFPLASGSDFSFTLDPLSNEVDTSKSSYEILSTKLSLKLAKAVRALKWTALESAPSTTTPREPSTSTSKGIAYPTSSRSGTKNWDKLEKEAIKDAEEWEKPDGDAAANALFRDIFKNASPEVRRAMEKSYVESNGTALSTNWDEVSRGKVETKPPDTMVAKKWGE